MIRAAEERGASGGQRQYALGLGIAVCEGVRRREARGARSNGIMLVSSCRRARAALGSQRGWSGADSKQRGGAADQAIARGLVTRRRVAAAAAAAASLPAMDVTLRLRCAPIAKDAAELAQMLARLLRTARAVGAAGPRGSRSAPPA